MAGKDIYTVKHGKYLNLDHVLISRSKDLRKENDLRFHLVMYHAISTKNMKLSDMAKYHLLSHALEAFPELQELLDNA